MEAKKVSMNLFLVIAITAMTLFLIMGTIKQAQAYNMVVAIGAQKTGNAVVISRLPTINEQDSKQPGLMKDKEREDLAKVEPAAG
ncbi:MAG: hypothetical protein ACLFR0_09110 [Alphaproteobacteria bacterium]